MPKRVSLKGKGADLFFGDLSPTRDTDVIDNPGHSADGVAGAERPAAEPDQARVQASKHASTPRRARGAEPDVSDEVWAAVDEPATVTNSFRYTNAELEELADVLYELGKRHRAKLSKQDVARLGLGFVLWDYRTRGDTSVLGQLAQRRKRRREG